MSELKPGIYQHYKNRRYELIGQAIDSDTHEAMVVYRGLYDDAKLGHHPLFVRSKKVFLENVMFDGKEIPRFTFIQSL